MANNSKLSLFDEPDGCEAYRVCRDGSLYEPVRKAFDEAWCRLGHLCPEKPEQFIKQFRQDFNARGWELYLLAVLTDAGLTLERAAGTGPDILVRLASGKKCWIEAVAPTPGSGENAV